MGIDAPLSWVALGLAAAGLSYGAYEAHRKAIRPALLRRRLERMVRRGTSYEITGRLGMGREGAVFEVRAARPGDFAGRTALKIRNPSSKRKHTHRMEKLRAKIAALESMEPSAAPCMMGVLEAGEIEEGGRWSAYQVMELIEGRTLGELAKSGDLAAAETCARLQRVGELLDSCLALERAGLHVVHADPDNIMIDGEGRLRLIDLEGIYLGALSEKDRLRQLRRLSRSTLRHVGDAWDRADFGARGERAGPLLAKLKAHAKTGAGERPPEGLGFGSLVEMRDSLMAALGEGGFTTEAQRHRE